jgi:HlyD family secretion protein
MKTKKLLKYALIVLAVLILFMIIGRQMGWIGSAEAVRVSTEMVERRDIVEIVTASGRIRPVTEVKISPDVSGEIILLNVKEGDFVERGQLLARINPDLYESALDRVNAALNTSRANLANARARFSQTEAQLINQTASYNRNKQLFDQDAISESEYDAARAQYLVAQSEVEAAGQSVVAAEFQVKSAEAAVSEARESLYKTNIFSPMDGTVSRLDVELGERVVGTSQFAGTEIMRIANLNQMEVLVSVNENDIIRVNQGDTAIIEVDAFYTDKFTGLVTSIANSALVEGLTVDQVTNFEVRIMVLPESYSHLQQADLEHVSPFRPGMSATADIRTKRVYNVLSVPIQAVTTREDESSSNAGDVSEEETSQDTENTETAENTADGSNPEASGDTETAGRPNEYVFVYNNGVAKRLLVTSGIQDSQFIEIIEGLEEDAEVITGPYRVVSRTLSDGDAVEKVKRQDLFSSE